MSEDYTQPFCTLGSKGKFAKCYQGKAYLPPLQYPSEPNLEERVTSLEMQYQYIDPYELQKGSKLYDKCQQLQGRQNYLQLQVDDIKRTPARQGKGKHIKYE